MRQYGAKQLNARYGCQCCVPHNGNGLQTRRHSESLVRVNRASKKAARQDAKRLVREEA
jgi:hypothetical protein